MDSAKSGEAEVFTRRYAQCDLDCSSVLMDGICAGVVIIDAVPKRLAIFLGFVPWDSLIVVL